MKTFQISAASYQSEWGNVEKNIVALEKAAFRAAEDNPRLLLLPEICLTGAPWLIPKKSPTIPEGAVSLKGPEMGKVQQIAKKTKMIIAVGLFEKKGTRVHVTQALVDKSGVLGAYRKAHEGKFSSMDKPLFPVFELPFARVGISICFDVMFPECARILALRGAEVYLAPFASLPLTRKTWRTMRQIALQARAQDNRMFTVSASISHPHVPGMPPEWGNSGICCAIDPLGRKIAESKGRAGTPQYMTTTLEAPLLRTYFLADLPPLRARRAGDYREIASNPLQEDYMKGAAAYRMNKEASTLTI